MYYVVIGVLLTFAVVQILRLFGVFETAVGGNRVKKDVALKKEQNNQRRKEIAKLQLFAGITDMVRDIFLSKEQYDELKFMIDRLEIRSDVLDRNLTPEELKGKQLLWLVAALICIPFGVFFTIFWAAAGVFALIYLTSNMRLRQKIQEEDEIINMYFIDLYLMMYSKLRQGSRARLQEVVESYIDTLSVSNNVEVQRVMTKFANFFLNNLAMYEDHKAVPKLRDRYKSATIVNFCNVASQALQGIDNSDNLLTLKQELVRRKTDMMKQKAEKLRKQGERAIMLIYVILFIFIGVGWYSKLPTDFFGSMFG